MLQNAAAERVLLSALCSYGKDVWYELEGVISEGIFSLSSNQILFSIIKKCLEGERENQQIQWPEIVAAAKILGYEEFLEETNEQKHLASILRTPSSKELAKRYAVLLWKLQFANNLSNTTKIASEDLLKITGEEPVEKILAIVEEPLAAASLSAWKSSTTTQKMADGMEEYFAELMDSPKDTIGISSGFSIYDKAIGGGFRRGAMDIIAARAKAGKTTLVDNILIAVCNQGIPVLSLDTEMSAREHQIRLGACLSGLTIDTIETGKCADSEHNRKLLLDGVRWLRDKPCWYRSIIGENIKETLIHVRKWLCEHVGFENGVAKPCLVIYDYLKLMTDDSFKEGIQEYQAMGYLATEIKNFAGKYGCSFLCFAQLNRDGQDKDDITALAQSDRITWFCTSLSYWKRKTEEQMVENPDYNARMVCLLSRHGGGLDEGDYINYSADFSRARIKEGPTRNQLFKEKAVIPVNTKLFGENVTLDPENCGEEKPKPSRKRKPKS